MMFRYSVGCKEFPPDSSDAPVNPFYGRWKNFSDNWLLFPRATWSWENQLISRLPPFTGVPRFVQSRHEEPAAALHVQRLRVRLSGVCRPSHHIVVQSVRSPKNKPPLSRFDGVTLVFDRHGVKKVTFVPYAAQDHDQYTAKAAAAFAKLGNLNEISFNWKEKIVGRTVHHGRLLVYWYQTLVSPTCHEGWLE